MITVSQDRIEKKIHPTSALICQWVVRMVTYSTESTITSTNSWMRKNPSLGFPAKLWNLYSISKGTATGMVFKCFWKELLLINVAWNNFRSNRNCVLLCRLGFFICGFASCISSPKSYILRHSAMDLPSSSSSFSFISFFLFFFFWLSSLHFYAIRLPIRFLSCGYYWLSVEAMWTDCHFTSYIHTYRSARFMLYRMHSQFTLVWRANPRA